MRRFPGRTPALAVFNGFSTIGRVRALVASILLATILAACHSAPPAVSTQSELDDEPKEWAELAAQLPPAPQPGDLVGFYVSPATQFRFSLDRKSISIGSDGVVRYTLVGISDLGAKNVSYEGMRCATWERKLYAVGRSDGSWAPSRNKNWQHVWEANTNRQHAELMKELLCPDRLVPKDAKEILERLARGSRGGGG